MRRRAAVSSRNATSEPSTRNTRAPPPGAVLAGLTALPGRKPSSIRRRAISSGRSRRSRMPSSPLPNSANVAGCFCAAADRFLLLKFICSSLLVSGGVSTLSRKAFLPQILTPTKVSRIERKVKCLPLKLRARIDACCERPCHLPHNPLRENKLPYSLELKFAGFLTLPSVCFGVGSGRVLFLNRMSTAFPTCSY